MTNTFKDEDLQDVYLQYGHVLNWNTEMLNDLSSDIRALDKLLSGHVSKEIVLLQVAEGKRLLWRGQGVEFSTSTIGKKLIECPKEIRIMCKPYLAQFLKLCIEKTGEI